MLDGRLKESIIHFIGGGNGSRTDKRDSMMTSLNTTFNNTSGLTGYALACGYVQRVETIINDRHISVTLWKEHDCFHVRAHDFTVEGRLNWISEKSLTDARYHYNAMIRQYLGQALKEKKDRRYTVRREFNGRSSAKYVIRFCGEYVSYAEDKLSAEVMIFNHKNNLVEFL